MYHNEREHRILDMYEKEQPGKCQLCQMCKEKCKRNNLNLLPNPTGVWFVGNNYSRQKKRVVFVGKTAIGQPGGQDSFDGSRTYLWPTNHKYNSMFWLYTYRISKIVFHSEEPEDIAMTNLIKCNTGSDKDITNDDIKSYCIQQNQFIKKELKILLPTHIIFYTHRFYDNFLKYVFDNSNFENVRAINKFDMPWGEGIGYIGDNKMHFLRTRHPQGAKTDFVQHVSDWIIGTS